MSPARRQRAAMPPTTPPAMTPVWEEAELLAEGVGPEEDVGGDSADEPGVE